MRTISVGLPALLLCANLLASQQSSNVAHAQANVQIVKRWKLFTYNFPPQAPIQNASFYDPLSVAATCITVHGDRIFVATPRLFSGVPATLSFAPLTDFNESPVLQAYPNWSYSTSWRTNFKCTDMILVSVYRMRVDSCNRLWVLDAGRSRSFEDNEATCPPKILVFDLNTNQVVRRIELPADVLRPSSLLTNLLIDETTSKSHTCDDVYLYISDSVRPAIVVYDSKRDSVWRLSHPAMFPDPDFAQMQILGDRFSIMDGIIGLAFDTHSNIIYFQPLATDSIYSVTRDTLRAGPLAQHEILPVCLVGRKSSPGLVLFVTPHDNSLVYSPLRETVLAAWNPYNNKHTVLQFDTQRLQFVADIHTSRTDPGAMYVVSSRFQRFLLRNVNRNEIHTRLMRIPLTSLGSSNFYPVGSVTNHYQLNSLASYNLTGGNTFNYFTTAMASTQTPTRLPLAQSTPMRYSYQHPIASPSNPSQYEINHYYGGHTASPYVPLNWA